jgi:hypothetical protein
MSSPPKPAGESLDFLTAAPAVPLNAPGPSPSDRPSVPAATQSAGPAASAEECAEECEEEGDEPRRLFDFPALQRRNVSVHGWIDQGITWNPDSPANRFNGPVTFNDRSNEYMLNQAYLIGERVTNTECRDFDLGGRIDLVYGTDSRFLGANGLEYEVQPDGSVNYKWNRANRFYGLAMPQVYGDLAWKDFVFRVGRFYTIAGYEVCTAPDNFFYSHSYTTQYGEPFTHTGMLAKWKANDRLSLTAGLHQGWDQWEYDDGKLGFLLGANWTSCNEKTTLALSLVSSDEQSAGQGNRNLVSLVWQQKLGEKLRYVLQGDMTHEEGAINGTQDAEWYGLVNYLYYDLNACWSLGARYEWFTDDDGVRVAGLGYPKGINLNAVPSHWQEVSLGVNYKPNANVLVRSEVRWDWVDPLIEVSDGPFDDYTNRGQFLWGTDLIVKF